MKVAVTGASGNVGTALLGVLREESRIDELVGLSRRLPDLAAEPYEGVTWEQVDLAAPSPGDAGEEHIVDRLAVLLADVDVVVHLAWMIQPNRERELLRRANVQGTRRVVQACLRAEVGHLVCVSSVAAYSGVEDDDPRDESWPTGGLRSSHYAVDKAAQEDVLDEAEEHGLTVARVRPALVFDADAGAEITRLFLGALVPPGLLRPGSWPVLPLPEGFRIQVVHGDDLAEALRTIIVNRAAGAFNIATEPVLGVHDLARIVDHGRSVAVPEGLLRRIIDGLWRARAVAADPGWLDLAMHVPVMDTTRARTELEWSPRCDAEVALRELLTAMAEGEGAASAPMRPRRDWPHDQARPGDVRPDGPIDPGEAPAAHRLPAALERDLLGLYLSDHLTGATAGVERLQRMADAYADSDLGSDLRRLAAEIGDERAFLADLISTLQLRQRPHRQAAAWVAEKVGRLKTNDRVTGSPMTPLLEIELMRSAVIGKLGLWQALTELAPDLGLPAELFTALSEQAREQVATLERLHQVAIPRAFRVDGSDDV